MKSILKYSLGLLLLGIVWSCENSMPEYDDPEAGIRFPSADTVTLKSFIYDEPGTTEGIVYVKVQSVGFVKDYDRSVQIEQMEVEDVKNAEVGVHYLPLSDSYFIPAHQAEVTIPITILNDTSLRRNRFVLRLALVENEDFKIYFEKESQKEIQISNLLTQPTNWSEWYFGTYGSVKHQFLIDISGEKWDEEYLTKLHMNYSQILFWRAKAMKELKAENAKREKEGKGPLREDPLPRQDEGILVEIPVW